MILGSAKQHCLNAHICREIHDFRKSMRLLNSEMRVWTVLGVHHYDFQRLYYSRLLMHTGYANIHSITVLKFLMACFIYIFCMYTISQNKNIKGIRKKQSKYSKLCYVEPRKWHRWMQFKVTQSRITSNFRSLTVSCWASHAWQSVKTFNPTFVQY